MRLGRRPKREFVSRVILWLEDRPADGGAGDRLATPQNSAQHIVVLFFVLNLLPTNKKGCGAWVNSAIYVRHVS